MSKNIIGLVYKITNNLDGKIYVGQTTSTLLHRFGAHKSASRQGRTTLISTAIREFGEDNFSIEVLEKWEAPDDKWDGFIINAILIREQVWIEKLNSADPNIGYNTMTDKTLLGQANALDATIHRKGLSFLEG
jgi:group I intron endonuclease